jgi:hypothetical protein
MVEFIPNRGVSLVQTVAGAADANEMLLVAKELLSESDFGVPAAC